MNSTITGLAVPNFSAPMTSGKIFKLSDYEGKHVVLYFYPKDSTPGCTNESIQFNELLKSFSQKKCLVFGISRDSLKSHENFRSKHGFSFDLISDSDEAVCQMFDVIKMKNMYGKQVRGIERSTFLIGPNGVLKQEWRKVSVSGHAKEVLDSI
ncbi:MAG: peroxiredoxin [Burkholderiales bacterium]|nr:peroxiredoxin [Burkholderiales bacterium]OUT76738.1 MAG: peroxiredoxin [Betaproteobacteria bacterium TMED22]|tara:strand:+ start:36060 stop:36518 length:459 start_codon:yes stop_codon:yes gene_type:complete